MLSRLRTLPYLIPPAFLLFLLALWCRSNLPGQFFLLSRDGAVRLVFVDGPWSMGLAETDKDHYNPAACIETMRTLAQRQWQAAGIEWIAGPTPLTRAYPGQYRVISISYAYPVLLTAAASVWCLATLRRTAPRRRPGHCPTCGYDLRGNTAAATCPECGTTPNTFT